MGGNLTPKQAMFVAEYLIDCNATRAAIKAGFSEASAAVTGARLLKNSKIAGLVAARRAQRAKKLEVTAEHVLEELAKLAFYDPIDLFDDAGNVKPITELDDVTRAAIAGIDVERKDVRGSLSITKKIRLADKGQNLERLGKHLKLFTDLHEHSGRLTLEQLVCGDGQDEAGGGEQAA